MEKASQAADRECGNVGTWERGTCERGTGNGERANVKRGTWERANVERETWNGERGNVHVQEQARGGLTPVRDVRPHSFIRLPFVDREDDTWNVRTCNLVIT